MMLADIIVAVVLLGVALAVMVGMTGRAISAQNAGEQFQTAAMLIDEQLNLVLARGPDSYASRFPVEGPCDPPFDNFRYKLEITGGDSGDAYAVSATVSWVTGGRPQSATVQTRIAPRRGDEPDPDRKPQETVDRLQ
jgi:Tfp pilus assembly protein PilV